MLPPSHGHLDDGLKLKYIAFTTYHSSSILNISKGSLSLRFFFWTLTRHVRVLIVEKKTNWKPGPPKIFLPAAVAKYRKLIKVQNRVWTIFLVEYQDWLVDCWFPSSIGVEIGTSRARGMNKTTGGFDHNAPLIACMDIMLLIRIWEFKLEAISKYVGGEKNDW